MKAPNDMTFRSKLGAARRPHAVGAVAAVLVLVVGLAAPRAWAQTGATSLLMGSVATHAGVVGGALTTSAATQAAGELRARVRLLRVFGVEAAWSPWVGGGGGGLFTRPRLRVAAQLWVVPLSRFGAYLTAGLGARQARDLFSIAGMSTSYQAGAGAEVYLDDHWAIGAEYLMFVPGVRAIQREAIERELARQRGSRVASLRASDVVDPANFQITVGVRFYFGVDTGRGGRSRGSLHAREEGQQGSRLVAQCEGRPEGPAQPRR